METLKELLEKYRIINRTELGRMIWPDANNPNIRMSMKVSEKVFGNGKQRFTEDDEKKAKKVLGDICRDILEWTEK